MCMFYQSSFLVACLLCFSRSVAMDATPPIVNVPGYQGNRFIGGSPVYVIDQYGSTSLHDLARMSSLALDHMKNAEIYLRSGADPNARDNSQNAPAHYAAENNYTELLFLLLNFGGHVDLANDKGETIFSLLKDPIGKVIFKFCNLAQLTEKNSVENDISLLDIFNKVSKSQPQALKFLTEHVNVNFVDSGTKYTALHCVILLQLIDSVTQLLARGANTEARDRLGYTPLALAIKNGSVSSENIISLLLTSKASVLARSLSGTSIAQLANKAQSRTLRGLVNCAIVRHQQETGKIACQCPCCNKCALLSLWGACNHLLCEECKNESNPLCPLC